MSKEEIKTLFTFEVYSVTNGNDVSISARADSQNMNEKEILLVMQNMSHVFHDMLKGFVESKVVIYSTDVKKDFRHSDKPFDNDKSELK